MADAHVDVIIKLADLDQVRDYILTLIETLQFYANPDNYKERYDKSNTIVSGISEDAGQRARDILKERL